MLCPAGLIIEKFPLKLFPRIAGPRSRDIHPLGLARIALGLDPLRGESRIRGIRDKLSQCCRCIEHGARRPRVLGVWVRGAHRTALGICF